MLQKIINLFTHQHEENAPAKPAQSADNQQPTKKETENKETEQQPQKPKTMEIYNLIILDESGSMSCVRKQTISGCNEVINTVRAAAKKYAGAQKHYMSIYAFQGGGEVPSRYLVKNAGADGVEHITEKDYEPYGSTPLYDAVGGCLADLKICTKGKQAIASVTIITDGCENSSRRYTHAQVAQMIAQLKELGWNFNFIGANIDAKETAEAFNIDNSLQFEQSAEGTQRMFRREARSRGRYYARTMACMDICADASPETLQANLAEAATDFYDEDEDDKKDADGKK